MHGSKLPSDNVGEVCEALLPLKLKALEKGRGYFG